MGVSRTDYLMWATDVGAKAFSWDKHEAEGEGRPDRRFDIVYDGMSGASPLFFNALSGASGEGVRDYRTAADVKLTKFFDRYSIGVGAAYSHERDYISRAGSIELRTWTADKNRTYAFGFAGSRRT